jgi:hypothetical protein
MPLVKMVYYFAGGCPLTWSSKLLTTIALLTTEAEYIGFSSALHDIIYVMQLLEELLPFGIEIPVSTPTV